MKEKKFWKPGSQKPSEVSDEGVESREKKQSRPGLSKSILSMKFMTKKVEIEELKREENKKRKLLSDSEWSGPSIATTARESTAELRSIEVNENESYSDLPGRRSFGGFNPSVERIYGDLDDSQNKVTREKEIVANFDKLVSLPRGPNQGVMQSVGGDRKKNQKKGKSKR